MLPPSYLDAMPDAFVQLAQQVEDEILQDVARRIGKMGTLTETADWQLWRYQQTEAVRENVVKLLAKYSGKSEATIRRLLKEAATEAMEREDAIYYHYNLEPTPFEESAALNNLLNAGARQTCGTWRNLTATTANTVSGAFERTLDVACPGFAVDCLETLEEIAMQNADAFRAAGGGEFRYIPCLNDGAAHAEALAAIAGDVAA